MFLKRFRPLCNERIWFTFQGRFLVLMVVNVKENNFFLKNRFVQNKANASKKSKVIFVESKMSEVTLLLFLFSQQGVR